MHPVAALSTCPLCEAFKRVYAPKCIKVRVLSVMAIVNGGGSLRLDPTPEDMR